jgi:hypothetical protein
MPSDRQDATANRAGSVAIVRSFGTFSMTRGAQKIRDCIRIAPLLRERVLRVAFDCKAPRDAEFTLT